MDSCCCSIHTRCHRVCEGDSEKGKKYVVGAVIAAVIMAFYTAIITGLIG